MELFGRTIASSASSASSAATSSAVDGLAVWPPATTRIVPTGSARVSKRRRFPSPATTATTPVLARVDGTSDSRRSRSLLLLAHVGDLDALDRARGGAERQRRARLVGVDVHLQRGLVADHDERVAEPLELRLEPVAIERLALDHEDGAVAVAGRLEVDRRPTPDGASAAGAAGNASPLTALARPRRSSTSPAPPASTTPASRRTSSCSGVRATASSPCRTSSTSRAPSGSDSARAPLGLLRQLADDRQHRPLDRPPHRAVRSVGSATQRTSGQRRVDPVRRFHEDVGDAAHDLGQDHARVAARAHQRGACDRVRERRPVGRLRRVDGVRHGAHRQREVGAGVAVGHGVDVEVVDAAAARLERGERGADEIADELEIALRASLPAAGSHVVDVHLDRADRQPGQALAPRRRPDC